MAHLDDVITEWQEHRKEVPQEEFAELSEEIDHLRQLLIEAQQALETATCLLNQADFTNGVTDGTGTIDEGRVKAGWMMDDIRALLTRLEERL